MNIGARSLAYDKTDSGTTEKKSLFVRIFGGVSIDCIVVCVYFLCMPFTVVPIAGGMSLLKVIAVPLLCILGLRLFIGNTKPLRFNMVHLVYAVYIVYTFSGLISYRSDLAVETTREMAFSFAAVLMMTLRVYNDKERELIESTWIIVGFLCTYLCLFHSRASNEYTNRKVIEIFGAHEDPNTFCMYFIMPTMIAVKRILEKRKLRFVYLAEMLLILYAVMQSGSRGGLIGIVLGLAFCVIFAIRSVKGKILFAVVAILAAAVTIKVIFPMLPEDVQQRYSVDSVLESGGTGRFDIWEFSLEYVSENPIRLIKGAGVMSTYSVFADVSYLTAKVAHNQFVQVLVDQGMLGLLLYILLLAACALRNIKDNPFYTCALISLMAFAMSLTLYTPKAYINILLMCSMDYLPKDDGGGIKPMRIKAAKAKGNGKTHNKKTTVKTDG